MDVHAAPRLAGAPAPDGRVLRGVRRDHGDPGAQGSLVRLLTPAAYFYAFAVLRWPWRLAGVAAVAVVAGTAQSSGIDKGTVLGLAAYLAVLAVNVLPMCSLTWLDRYNDQQKDRRELALAEVSEAKSKLEATLAENAGLHQQLLTQA